MRKRHTTGIPGFDTFAIKYLADSDCNARQIIVEQFLFPECFHDASKLYVSLSKSPVGISVAMKLRDDARVSSSSDVSNSPWQSIDRSLQEFLGVVFSVQSLSLRRITFDSSSGNVLESVARGEVVAGHLNLE